MTGKTDMLHGQEEYCLYSFIFIEAITGPLNSIVVRDDYMHTHTMCIFCHLGLEVFRESDHQLWPFPTLKKLFALLTTYKGKFNRGITTLFEQYDGF
jgi:hypothetical protein